MSDVDSKISDGGWTDLNKGPKHGIVRNALYLDWHVKSYKGTNLMNRLLKYPNFSLAS